MISAVKNINYNVYRKGFINNMVTVTGTTQSGKSLIGPTVCSLDRAENYRTDFVLEQIPMLHGLNLVDEEVAIFLLRYGTELMQYDNMIGRNTNFRYSDFSSIWLTKDPSEFYKRLTMEEGKSVYDRIEKENPLFVLNFHNGVMHADLLLKAFPSQKILHVVRNPVDVAYAWFNKGYGKKETYQDPRIRVLTFEYKNTLLPYYAKGCEDEYLDLNEMDRVIRLLYSVHSHHLEAFKNLDKKEVKNIYTLYFEDFAQDTNNVLNKICNFIGTSQTSFTSISLKREKVPRIINPKEVIKKMNFINEITSDNYISLLEDLLEKHKNKKLI